MDQPVDEAVPDKNQGTGNGLLPVTEVQRAVCENPRNWREATAIEKKGMSIFLPIYIIVILWL